MIFITDDIKAVVAAMRPVNAQKYGQPFIEYLSNYTVEAKAPRTEMPYYMAGHPMEIAARLLEKDQDSVYKYQKYPLVVLKMDIPEPYREGGFYEYDLNVAFIAFTEKNWNYEERLEKVIKPVLAPMYERFLAELWNIGGFVWDGDARRPPHVPIIRPFWGTENSTRMGNEKSIINDPLDAIEIKSLKIKKSIKC